MSLKNEILNNWQTDIEGFAQSILSLSQSGFPCWTVKYYDSYGVAIPYCGDEGINEKFSNARIRNDVLNINGGVEQQAVILTADFTVSKESFATLCEELVSPGENGNNRALLSQSPLKWWQNWKELLGNKNIDDRVYDTLGELCVLEYLSSLGTDYSWDGPAGATYDIETDTEFIEVKSSTLRNKKEVTISNLFQLDPPGKKLFLVLCQFESSIYSGVSINSVVSNLVNAGISYDYINSRLLGKGIEENTTDRRRLFILHDMIKYEVNDDFPRIKPSSFVGGSLPQGISKITYTVSLDGLQSTSLIHGDSNEVQNN